MMNQDKWRLDTDTKDIIVNRVLKFMRNQIARGALEDIGLRDVTLNNLTVMIIKDVEDAYLKHYFGDSEKS